MKFKVRSPKSEVWSRSLTSEVCPKFVWSLISLKTVIILHDGYPHWSAVLLILITYMYIYHNVFLELIWLHMYVCFCCVTNKLSESLCPKFDVCTMSDNEGYNRVKYVQSQQSEVWKLMSKVHNRKSAVQSLMKSKVWCLTSVRKLSELCPKSEVLRMSVQNLESKNQSLKSKVCPKSESETKVWSLSVVYIWNWSPESNTQNL